MFGTVYATALIFAFAVKLLAANSGGLQFAEGVPCGSTKTC